MEVENFVALIFSIIFIVNQCRYVEASCYFPQEFQGEYVMQSSASVGNELQYSTLSINENSIPIWGNCHRRIGNNFILMFNFSETSCIRCLHLKLRSSYVLQVFASSQETISKCFTNEESAETNCPSEESLAVRDTAEILLFKVKDAAGSYTGKTYCPIDGEFYINFKENNKKTQKTIGCSGFNSTLNSCPSGSTLNFKLRNCNFDSQGDIKFDCLGHWKGPQGDTFLIFTDSRAKKPKYRCALYKINPVSTKIEMALSRDSTCSSELYNSTNGYETFVFTPKGESSWPPEVAYSMCSFPEWMRGNWEHVRVGEDTMVYKDHSSFKTYTIKCVAVLEGEHKYVIFSRTQCNEESYNCLRVSKRSDNILEFQLGSNASKTKEVYTLCSDDNFQEDSWITQGRLDTLPEIVPGMCPITGEYTGVIPDATDLCAKLWSDCRAPELMYYQVSHCASEEVYEEREYQCLGHWREAELLYTYTLRRDVAAGTYECFVGSMLSENEIYIKEAGEHCQRHINPLLYGMKLTKKNLYTCITKDTSSFSTSISAATVPSVSRRTTVVPTRRTTTKPWNIGDNSIPNSDNEKKSSGSKFSVTSVTCVLYICVHLLRVCL